MINIDKLDFSKLGNDLLPVVVQNNANGQILMLAFANFAAVQKSIETKQATFFSRSRNQLWTKGETSGNFLKIIDIVADCDNDSLLYLCEPHGPTCHTGRISCFGDKSFNLQFLTQLEQIISSRKDSDEEKSYVRELFKAGNKRIAQKVGEEGVEVALATDKDELLNESADLLFHLLVLLQAKNCNLNEVVEVLINRHKQK